MWFTIIAMDSNRCEVQRLADVSDNPKSDLILTLTVRWLVRGSVIGSTP